MKEKKWWGEKNSLQEASMHYREAEIAGQPPQLSELSEHFFFKQGIVERKCVRLSVYWVSILLYDCIVV